MWNPFLKPYHFSGSRRAEHTKENIMPCDLKNITYQAANLWNEMPSYIKEATSSLYFKSISSKWAVNATVALAFYCIFCKVYEV